MEEEVREGKGVGVGGAFSSITWILCLEALFKICPWQAGILEEVSGEGLYRTVSSFSDVSFFSYIDSSKYG